MGLISNDNFVVIQGFMVNDLKLKGNELLVYAVIYGFSQLEGQKFTGSLQYLADWTNSSKQGVLKNLKSLVEKGLIGKNDILINGVKYCEYYSTKFNGVLNKVERPIKQSSIPPIKQSLPNNIEINNIENNIENNNLAHSAKSTNEPEEKPIIKMPLVSKVDFPKYYLIFQKQIDEWQELYPNVDVLQQLRNMVGWCNANRDRRKTEKGVNRFINSWLAKEQNKNQPKQDKFLKTLFSDDFAF